MSSKMETFSCIIFHTNYMSTLWIEKFDEYLECIKLTKDLDKFEKVEDFVKLNNKHINNAIKEILSNEKFMKDLAECDIYINKKFMSEKGLI